LLQPLVFLLLVLDILADRLFVASNRAHEITARPEVLPYEIALFPLMYPTTFDTASFGGIDNSM
jgi:hypothetical protein